MAKAPKKTKTIASKPILEINLFDKDGAFRLQEFLIWKEVALRRFPSPSLMHYCLLAVIQTECLYYALELDKEYGDFASGMEIECDYWVKQDDLPESTIRLLAIFNALNASLYLCASKEFKIQNNAPSILGEAWFWYGNALENIGYLKGTLGIDLAISNRAKSAGQMGGRAKHKELKAEVIRLSMDYPNDKPTKIATKIYRNVSLFADANGLPKLSEKEEFRTIAKWIAKYRE